MNNICKAMAGFNGVDFVSAPVVPTDLPTILEEDKKYGVMTPRNGIDFTYRVLNEDNEISIKQIEKSVYPLPSSASVIKQLTDYEVGYIIGLTNPPENIKKYFISSKKERVISRSFIKMFFIFMIIYISLNGITMPI